MDRQPLCLLADSQLLFFNDATNTLRSYLYRFFDSCGSLPVRAAYIGASNGDLPEYFQLFNEAMDSIGDNQSMLIPSSPSDEQLEFVTRADVILLAGGDTASGWKIINESGIAERVRERYFGGAFLIGISAGAIQLGLGFENDRREGASHSTDTFRLVPHFISVHDPAEEWLDLHAQVGRGDAYGKGFGIAAGGGLFYHPDGAVEPIRRPLTELVNLQDGHRKVETNILLPPVNGQHIDQTVH